jgi:hypothetical protein
VDWRPDRCQRIALVPQGGGALGAYQAGVYKALPEASTKRTLKRQDWLEMPAEGAGIVVHDVHREVDR